MSLSPKPVLLEVRGVSASYQRGREKLPAIRAVDLELAHGETAALIGPSGCGKTTLFNVLAGLVEPEEGAIRLEGRPISNLRGRAAYMQQKDLLLPWRSALDNALLGLEIQGVPRDRARREAAELMSAFGLADFMDRRPHELSGGMRQRVALMRTILCRKDIWLLDEPFAALDAITRRRAQGWLRDIKNRFRIAVLLVTHDVDEALLLADRVHVMTSRPAAIRQSIDVSRTGPGDTAGLKDYLLELLEEQDNCGGPEGL